MLTIFYLYAIKVSYLGGRYREENKMLQLSDAGLGLHDLVLYRNAGDGDLVGVRRAESTELIPCEDSLRGGRRADERIKEIASMLGLVIQQVSLPDKKCVGFRLVREAELPNYGIYPIK